MTEIRTGDEDHRHCLEGRQIHDDGEAVDVEKRHDRQDPIARRDGRMPRPALMDVRDERSMRQHRALRHAGRTAGVLEDSKVRGRDVDRDPRTLIGEDVAEP